MESSDDSFAWTDASSKSKSEDSSLSEETMNENHNEFESEKGYKKKLHKKLFSTESKIKHELLNGHTVKPEPESDVAYSPRKRKRKRDLTSSSDSEAATDYLETGVKKERHIKHKDSPDIKPNKKIKNKYNEDQNYNKDISQDSELLDSSDHSTKKKKSKRKKEKKEDSSSEMIIEDKFSAEETVVQARPENEPTMSMYAEEVEQLVEKKKNKKKKKKDIMHVLQVDAVNGNNTKEIDFQEELNGAVTCDPTINNKSEKRKPNISDRIQFEDGEDLIAACNETNDSSGKSYQSSKLKRFLKCNPHLEALSCISDKDTFISQDDEIWLLNCPHEINVLSLKDSDMSLDNKCKIKIDSQTYVGNIQNEISRVAILTFQQHKSIIKNLELNGVVNLRKRIPKAHFVEDNIMANNQTDFIPLPDTKCRHPLFGPDYKKAMKIQPSVKARLNCSKSESLNSELIVKDGKKKRKRKYDERNENAVVTGGEAETGSSSSKPRKSSIDVDQPTRKKSKRVKQEKESSETWESEKAIEENLFIF